MYLHIGGDMTLRTGDIVGVFDLDNASRGKDTLKLLTYAQETGTLTTVGEGLPRSFILLNTGQVVFTSISSGTIIKRMHNPLAE